MGRYVVVHRVVQVMDDASFLRGDDAVTQAAANITIASTMSTARNKGAGQVFGASSNPPLDQQAAGAGTGAASASVSPVVVEGERSGN